MILDKLTQRYLKKIYKNGYANIPMLSALDARKKYSNLCFSQNVPHITSYVKYLENMIPLHAFLPVYGAYTSIILYLHGGGYVFRDLSGSAVICQKISNDNHACVVLIEYSLAPERKFPKAIHEVGYVIEYIARHQLFNFHKIDVPIFLLGESSGANLAIASLLNQSNLPVSGMILICPSLDYYSLYQSKVTFQKGFLLDKEIRDWFALQYLNHSGECKHPYVSVTLSQNLHVLPKILMINAFFDPLRDESYYFYHLLKNSNVSVKLKTLDTIHGFVNYHIEPYCSLTYKYISEFINHIE